MSVLPLVRMQVQSPRLGAGVGTTVGWGDMGDGVAVGGVGLVGLGIGLDVGAREEFRRHTTAAGSGAR